MTRTKIFQYHRFMCLLTSYFWPYGFYQLVPCKIVFYLRKQWFFFTKMLLHDKSSTAADTKFTSYTLSIAIDSSFNMILIHIWFKVELKCVVCGWSNNWNIWDNPVGASCIRTVANLISVDFLNPLFKSLNFQLFLTHKNHFLGIQ